MLDEGVVKFRCTWIEAPPLPAWRIEALDAWRERLYAHGLVGYDAQAGVGYGNLSMRDPESRAILVTGTQTGHLPKLGPEHYTLLTDYDIDENRVTCTGPVQASSESLTHLAVYEMGDACNAVVHVHDERAWRALDGRVPTTAPGVAYGTPAMARELQRLYREDALAQVRIAVMHGHEGGLIAFGEDIDAAGSVMLAHVRAVRGL
jgi:ribulose-5-phosphate 4-epimerase/fuculose-1-phosphate aldolase